MRVLIAIVAGFASGVFARSLFYFGWPVIVFVLLLAGLFVGARIRKPRRVYSLAALFFIFVALGAGRAALADTPPPEAFMRDLRHRVQYEGIVVGDPDVRDKNQRVAVRISSGGETATMLAVAPRYPTVAVGDTVFVSGTLALPEAFTDDNGRIFRYDTYLQKDGVRFLLNFAYLRVEQKAPWYSLPAALARVKHAFLNGLGAVLPEPHASLAGGVVIGGKSGLGPELKTDFMRSGLIHMVVLSGHNVMVVATWVIAFFALLFARVESVSRRSVPRSLSVGLGVFALILFVGVAGFSATALRAMLMAFIALYARATGRTYAAGRALFFVVLLMLLWNPFYLVFDPGFGLSVAATAGLIWLTPIIETFLPRIKYAFVKEVVTTTLAAQIAVLPLLLYFTGNLSFVSIPANLLVMPVVPLAMGFAYLAGFAGMLFSPFVPLLGILLALPSYLISAYFLFIASGSAALPMAAITLPPFPFWLVLAAYAVLIYVVASKRFSTTPQLRLAKNASI
mgnify:CR=1 FL=1